MSFSFLLANQPTHTNAQEQWQHIPLACPLTCSLLLASRSPHPLCLISPTCTRSSSSCSTGTPCMGRGGGKRCWLAEQLLRVGCEPADERRESSRL